MPYRGSTTYHVYRELLEEKYKGKLLPHYEAPQHSVVAQVFRGLSGKKVVMPSKDFVRYSTFLRCYFG
jgi:hypothetical protein